MKIAQFAAFMASAVTISFLTTASASAVASTSKTDVVFFKIANPLRFWVLDKPEVGMTNDEINDAASKMRLDPTDSHKFMSKIGSVVKDVDFANRILVITSLSVYRQQGKCSLFLDAELRTLENGVAAKFSGSASNKDKPDCFRDLTPPTNNMGLSSLMQNALVDALEKGLDY